ncbi:MAG TPA: hypothetical protein PKC05_03255 [Candidatus Saccharibacteria bacterium]|nr:hypothetical protein [Candidatus Saccharibacteria bacterium]
MKLITVSFAVLSLIPQFNYQPQPVATTTSDSLAIFYVQPVKEQFPDRSKEAEIARQVDAQREQARLQAIEAQKQAQAVQSTIVAQKAPVVAQNTPVDSNSAKMFIYMKESGNNPQARNSAGCLGLGQACPGSKLLAVCPTLDYACEDAFFTNYALSRYGSWEGALAFWQSHHWW